jgi:excisionase family DNA binding protein
MGSPKFQLKKICKYCGNEFIAHQLNTVYCCKKCAVKGFNVVKREARKEAERAKIAAAIPDDRDYISVPEARAMFGVAKSTIYRLIRLGKIPAINLGSRLVRISRSYMEAHYTLRTKKDEVKCQSDIFDMSLDKCYKMAEIQEKYRVCHAAIFKQIRRYGIPIRQIGTCVYAPKKEIDAIYKQGKANEKRSQPYKVHGKDAKD